jgi:hypothetical protein
MGFVVLIVGSDRCRGGCGLPCVVGVAIPTRACLAGGGRMLRLVYMYRVAVLATERDRGREGEW